MNAIQIPVGAEEDFKFLLRLAVVNIGDQIVRGDLTVIGDGRAIRMLQLADGIRQQVDTTPAPDVESGDEPTWTEARDLERENRILDAEYHGEN